MWTTPNTSTQKYHRVRWNQILFTRGILRATFSSHNGFLDTFYISDTRKVHWTEVISTRGSDTTAYDTTAVPGPGCNTTVVVKKVTISWNS